MLDDASWMYGRKGVACAKHRLSWHMVRIPLNLIETRILRVRGTAFATALILFFAQSLECTHRCTCIVLLSHGRSHVKLIFLPELAGDSN